MLRYTSVGQSDFHLLYSHPGLPCVTVLFQLSVAFAPPHTVRKDTVVEGYTLPAGCFILASLYNMHRDKEYWGDPDVFRIDRWFDGKGGLLLHESHFLPFSTGKCYQKNSLSVE